MNKLLETGLFETRHTSYSIEQGLYLKGTDFRLHIKKLETSTYFCWRDRYREASFSEVFESVPNEIKKRMAFHFDLLQINNRSIESIVAEHFNLKEPLTIIGRTSSNLKAWEVTDANHTRKYFERTSYSYKSKDIGWLEVFNQL